MRESGPTAAVQALSRSSSLLPSGSLRRPPSPPPPRPSPLEVCPAACALVQDVASALGRDKGAALFIDYGEVGGLGTGEVSGAEGAQVW